MLRCAQPHGIADPRWKAHGKYERVLMLDLGSLLLTLDLKDLNGRPFVVDEIGDYGTWYRIRDFAMVALRASGQQNTDADASSWEPSQAQKE
jgi:hypothetical protein